MASNIVIINIDSTVPSGNNSSVTSLQTVNVRDLKDPVRLEIPVS
jgi:hypothetical protein